MRADRFGIAGMQAARQRGEFARVGLRQRLLLVEREGIEPEHRPVAFLDVAEERGLAEHHAHEAAGRRDRRHVDEAAGSGEAGVDGSGASGNARRRVRDHTPSQPATQPACARFAIGEVQSDAVRLPLQPGQRMVEADFRAERFGFAAERCRAGRHGAA